jgi:predicted nucleotidyltransferase
MANMTLDELVAQLKSAYGDALRSVVLYGSAAAGEHIPKRSDYNVLVLADSLDAPRLRAAAAVARAWADSGNPPPMTLTVSEWKSSSDVFPMEYSDILERHRVLFGAAPFDGITVSKPNLRLQVEREAMGKLLQFRQGVLAAGNDPKRELALLEASLSAIMVTFRGVARLAGDTPSVDNETLAQVIGARAGFDATPITRVVRHVRGDSVLTAREAEPVIAAYLHSLERLVEFIDRLPAE